MHKTTPITQEGMEDFYKSLSSLLSFFLLLTHGSLATAGDPFPNEQEEGSQRQVYIVHVQPQEMTTFATLATFDTNDKEAYYKSFLPVTTASTGESSPMVYMYDKVISGFAARLTALDLDEMSKKDGFLAAYPSRTHSLQTTHTPQFLGLNIQNGIWNQSFNGEGIIVGVIDTGVFPNHPSFSGEGMPKPPSKWKGRCDFDSSLCNNKLIGARAFLNGTTDMSPLDDEGHGTHTASTAAGAAVAGAEVLGNAMGVASGMAPRAHLAIYKVCGVKTCLDADILAAMDTAISDGVDVLSLSLGGESWPFFEDGVAVGAFGAIEHGVFVSCSAGNSGPFASSLANEAPWILTVAASTMDRSIISTVKLGNGLSFNGQSLNQSQFFAPSTFYPLVYAGASGNTNATFCGNGSFDGFDVRGKIVLCERGGGIARIEKGVNVKTAGGFGMILMNQAADGFSTHAERHVLPASHVSYSDGLKIKAYINSTLNSKASFSFKGTVIGTAPAPAITSFSSRGPSIESPGILKPDITGPGVSVLAAWPSLASSNSSQVTFNFNMMSGTSMSTPHLSGIAALIKTAHPDWSPAAIKSAMMTTADIMDHSGKLIVDERHLPANLFAVGAGHVNPAKASDPGLVYDLKPDDYIPYLCGLGYNSTQVGIILRRRIDCSSVKTITEGELNYPSFLVAFIDGKNSITFERTVKNVGMAESTFCVKVDVPGGVYVNVQPNELRFSETNQEMKFKVTFNKSNMTGTVRYSQGYLNWISDKHTVRSPISVAF